MSLFGGKRPDLDRPAARTSPTAVEALLAAVRPGEPSRGHRWPASEIVRAAQARRSCAGRDRLRLLHARRARTRERMVVDLDPAFGLKVAPGSPPDRRRVRQRPGDHRAASWRSSRFTSTRPASSEGAGPRRRSTQSAQKCPEGELFSASPTSRWAGNVQQLSEELFPPPRGTLGGDSGGPLAAAAPDDAGAGARADRTRRTPRCRHGVSSVEHCSGRINHCSKSFSQVDGRRSRPRFRIEPGQARATL